MTRKSNKPNDQRISTGIPNLDAILHGGLPVNTVTVIAGQPGSGKTVLSQQIGFFNASPDRKVIFFQTLSEPTAKRLRYLKSFNFFDAAKFDDDQVRFIDLGASLRSHGIETTLKELLEHVKRERPAVVVIDSFRAFDDFVTSPDQHRRFSYEVVVNLMAWECTVLLLGEFSEDDMANNPLFSVIDGIIVAGQKEVAGEQRRILQVIKMRGTDHSRDKHPFSIRASGIQLYAPRVTIQRDPAVDKKMATEPRCATGITGLDALLAEGISHGSSMLVAGAAGTGKTIMMLEMLYRGAVDHGQKGILFTFEETVERISATGRSFGWDIEGEIERGMLQVVYVPQPEILVEEHILMIREMTLTMGATRIAIDSLSVFLDKVESVQMVREKIYQLATIVQMAGGIGLFSVDVPLGVDAVNRYAVAETVVDGSLQLGTTLKDGTRERFIEISKLRNTAHVLGRRPMAIGKSGIAVAGVKSVAADAGKMTHVRNKKKAKKSR